MTHPYDNGDAGAPAHQRQYGRTQGAQGYPQGHQQGYQPYYRQGYQQGYGQQYDPQYYRPQQQWQPAPQAPRRRRGRGCLKALVALVVAAVVLAAVVVFGGPLLARAGLPAGLADAVGQLRLPFELPLANTALSEEDEQRLDRRLTGYYVYDQLDADDQQKYRIMFDALESRGQRDFPYEGTEDLSRIRSYIIADHPELFYVKGVNARTTTQTSIFGESSATVIEGIYRHDQVEEAALQVQLEAAAAACLAGAPAGDDYAKAKYLYEYLVETVEYDSSVYDYEADGSGDGIGQTAVDALVGRSAVCAGYSNAFQYLAQQLGLTCVYVTGTARGEAHAWNIVQLDGEFYCVDATWGDPQFVGEDGGSSDVGRINYDYLCVTDAELAMDHALDEGSIVPSCTSTADNYYVREGLLLDAPDVDRAGSIVRGAQESGQVGTQFRCTDQGTYDQLRSELFDQGRIYDYLQGDRCWYTTDDNYLSICVIFE